MPDPLDPDEARRKIERALEIQRIKRELRRRRAKPPKEPRPPNPLHHISWNTYLGKWQVRISKDGRWLIRRFYKTQAAAIAARDQTLATGRAPPARRPGRPRGSKLVRELIREMDERGELD